MNPYDFEMRNARREGVDNEENHLSLLSNKDLDTLSQQLAERMGELFDSFVSVHEFAHLQVEMRKIAKIKEQRVIDTVKDGEA